MVTDPLFKAVNSAHIPSDPTGFPLGLNQYSHMPVAQPPIPASSGRPLTGDGPQTELLTSLVYRVDRMANPDTSNKAGAVENIRRNEEIPVYVARYFGNNTVALRPGSFGKQLAISLNSLSEKLRPLYDQYRIPCGFTNRFCIAAACLYWGGRDKEEDYYLSESDFATWPTHDFDRYVSPSGWTLEQRSRAPIKLKRGRSMM